MSNSGFLINFRIFVRLVAIGATFASGAIARADECTLPVCDVPAYIEEMRDTPHRLRDVRVKELIKLSREATDTLVLENLMVVGKKTQILFEEVFEEDELVRDTVELFRIAIEKLIQNPKIELSKLKEYFLLLNTGDVGGTSDAKFRIKIRPRDSVYRIFNTRISLSHDDQRQTAARYVGLPASASFEQKQLDLRKRLRCNANSVRVSAVK